MNSIKTDKYEYSARFTEKPGRSYIAGYTLPVINGGDVPKDMNKAFSECKLSVKTAYMKQVHGASVKVISKPGRYLCDGIFTKEKGLALVVRTADCMPIIFTSPELSVIGVVHMGWRSAESGILDAIPFDLKSFDVIIGPGLRSCCYDVGEEFFSTKRLASYTNKSGRHLRFDPVSFIKDNLLKKGVAKERIYDTGLCTLCSPCGLHSHRKTKTHSRILSFVVDQGQ